MSEQGIPLATGFDNVSDNEWRALVEKSLKGKPFDKAMLSHTYDGLAVKALYTKENSRIGPRPKVRKGDWNIAVPHWNPDVKASHEAILEDLERGASTIAVRVAAGAFPGVAIDDLAELLEGVYLNMAGFTFIPGEEFVACSDAVLNIIESRGYPGEDVKGCLGIDPISILAQTGRLLTSAENAIDAGVDIAKRTALITPNVAAFTVDAGLYHIAGATEAQELGLMLAIGVQYLRSMEAAGMDLNEAARQIHFSLVTDADIYLTVAKFRAARLLWKQVLEACGVHDAPMVLSGVSSLRMVSVRDPWVNILRGTAACFAAGVGGADTICVLPHDTMLGMSGPQARRIARNIQIVLQEESGLSGVMDPAAGAYSFEDITLELNNNALNYFKKIESKGGVLHALRQGVIQQDMMEAWSARQKNIATRKDAITGVSEFPNIHETAIEDVGPMPVPQAALKPAGEKVPAIMFHRLAESFEAFRALGDSLKVRGARPAIFLACMGEAADYTARATFAKNLFEAGGLEAIQEEGGQGEGGSHIDEVVKAYKESDAVLVVLCSTDAFYVDCGEALARALKAEGAFVYVAGKPSNMAALERAGVGGSIYAGVNALEVYEQAYRQIGEAS